ncbi:MAG TPA: DHA2 family efflux MFS transporter permease subunit [Vicinamibacterales bacterium]|nr:DHA2 family efflux MFS transporter permease subunit [Vicinamibacterales bacterium]
MTAPASDVVTPQAWRTLRWTCTAVFMALLDATILFVAFPSIRRSFGSVSAADLSWILNAYTVVYAALLVPAGRLADRIGRRRVFLQGVGLFTLGSLACGLAPTPLLIVGGRVVQAVGGAMLTPSSLALILSAFPRPKWPIAVSLWAAVGALAAAIGPSLGAAIIQLGGWRGAFFVNLPIGLVTVIRGGAALTESRDTAAQEALDVIGIGLLMAAVGLVALALVKGQDWTAGRVLACYGVATVLLATFVLRARRVKAPALDLSLFDAASFRYANAATLVFGAAFSAMFLGSVLFLTSVWGYNTARAGLALTPGPLVVLLVAPLAGRVAGRVGQRALLVPGGALFGIGFLLRYLATSPAPHYLTEWLPAVVLTGVGVGLVLPSLASASAHSLPPHRFAVGSGVNQAIRQIGSVVGVSVVVVLVGSGRGADALGNFFNLFLFLCLAGFVTALLSMAIDTRAPV